MDPRDPQHQDRRRDTRARIALPTSIIRSGQLEPVEMIDASFRGLFVAMEEPPEIRSLVKLAIDLPGRPDKPLVVHAVVVRIVADLLGHRGVGLRFFALNGPEKAEWESFVQSAIRSQAVQTAA